MALANILRRSGTADMKNRPTANDVRVDSSDEKLKFKDGAGTVQVVVTEAQTQTLAGKTLTAPVINGGSINLPASIEDMSIAGYSPGLKNGAQVSASEACVIPHQTVLTLDALELLLADNGATASIGAKIYTFPAKAIAILGAVVDLVINTTDVGAAIDFDGGLGTAVAGADGTLATTEQDILKSTALTAAANSAPFKAASTLTEMIILDGSTAAKEVYLNFADAHDVGGAGKHLVVSGTIYLTWIDLNNHS